MSAALHNASSTIDNVCIGAKESLLVLQIKLFTFVINITQLHLVLSYSRHPLYLLICLSRRQVRSRWYFQARFFKMTQLVYERFHNGEWSLAIDGIHVVL